MGSLVTRHREVSISVVIPTLNEAESLAYTFARIPPCVDEIVIVDGHSSDGTVEVACALSADVRILLQHGKGKGNALACGFAAARGDIIVAIDADGSTDPAEIPAFVQPLLEGADFVKGSRFIEGANSGDITPTRGLGNKTLNGVVNVLFGTQYTDFSYSYSAFWRHCLEHMCVTTTSKGEIEALMSLRIARAGLKVAEVPSIAPERIYYESPLSGWRYGRWMMATIVRERLRSAPTQAPAPVDVGRLMRFVSGFLPGTDGVEWLAESEDHLLCVVDDGGRVWSTRLRLIGGLIRYVPRAWLSEITKRSARRP
jgi:glycosyltransferase involved in cell wall biosynthesis